MSRSTLQTREHFDICSMPGVRAGVVALTLCDLADADILELVRLEVDEFLAGWVVSRSRAADGGKFGDGF